MSVNTFIDNHQFNTQYPIRLLSISLLQHANFYSGDSVVRMQIDLQSYDEVFTNQISGFYEKLKNLIPSLYEHHCSEGVPGGFFIRVKDGTLLGHVIEHVAIELQQLAGMNVGFGKTRQSPRRGIYNVVFRYVEPNAAILAGKAALHCINSLLTESPCDIMDIVRQLVCLREMHMPLPTIQIITTEAKKKHIPFFLFEHQQYYILGSGKYQKKLFHTCTPATQAIATAIANDRLLTFSLLRKHHLPTPSFQFVYSNLQLKNIYINNTQDLIALPRFRKNEPNCLLISPHHYPELFEYSSEQQWIVYPYRSSNILQFLIIDNACVGVVHLIPPRITGDGKRTILELIRSINQEEQRTTKKTSTLHTVPIDSETRMILHAMGLDYDSILDDGQTIILKILAQKQTGAYVKQVNNQVNDSLKQLAIRAAQVVGLDVAVIELHCFDYFDSYALSDAYITEIYPSPDFTMFHQPSSGEPIHVADKFLNYLFKNQTHIPLIAITGSSGKSTCARIIYQYIQQFKTIGGIYDHHLFINNSVTAELSEINSEAIQKLLLTQSIEMAVLEVPVETIIHYGLGYQFADFGIVLNVHQKHIEELELHDEDDLAYAKSVVAEEVHPQGWAILNADDPLVREMSSRTISRIAWVTRKKQYLNSDTYAYVHYNTIEIKQNGSYIDTIRVENSQLLNERNEVFESVAAAALLLCLSGHRPRDIEYFLNNHFDRYC